VPLRTWRSGRRSSCAALGIGRNAMAELPPPIIDSLRLIEYAFNDENVHFTDKLEIYVGGEDGLDRLPEMAALAIGESYESPGQLYLLFCEADWSTRSAFPYTTVEEAKLQAERGYEGIRGNWMPSTYSEEDIKSFLREEYQVDPNTKWWRFICSFCGERPEGQCITGKFANICQSCVTQYYQAFALESDA
jgi:hypothetical protein